MQNPSVIQNFSMQALTCTPILWFDSGDYVESYKGGN